MTQEGTSKFFSNFKDKLSERFKALTSAMDPVDKRAGDLIDRATSELLIGPDWSLNMEVVDYVNSNLGENSEKIIKALRRAFHKDNVKVQILAVTVLETLIKNSHQLFHKFLPRSDLWADFELVADPSRKIDPEVKDKVLGLVEDCAKHLPDVRFRESYEKLLDAGVDFPVRAVDEGVPFYTPPTPPAATLAVPDGISDEDREAIAAAMAELEAEDRAARAAAGGTQQASQGATRGVAAAVPTPATGPAVAVSGPMGYSALPQSHTPPPATPPPPPPPPAATPAPDPEQALQVAKNSLELLQQLLAGLPASDPSAVYSPLVGEMAEACFRARSGLEGVINTAGDEALLASAISTHEELSRTLEHYNAALARAEAVPLVSTQGSGAPAAAVRQVPSPSEQTPAPTENFTLDEEDPAASAAPLQTRRGGGAAAAPLPVPILPPPRSSTSPPAADLISFESEPQQPAEPANLALGLDQLSLGGAAPPPSK